MSEIIHISAPQSIRSSTGSEVMSVLTCQEIVESFMFILEMLVVLGLVMVGRSGCPGDWSTLGSFPMRECCRIVVRIHFHSTLSLRFGIRVVVFRFDDWLLEWRCRVWFERNFVVYSGPVVENSVGCPADS